MIRWFFSAVLVALMISGGCASYPTENHKTLNDINYDAGKQIAAKSDDPFIKQAGQDVSANSEVLANTFLGWPISRAKYDAILSAKVRADALKEFQDNQPWYKKIAGVAIPVLSALLVAGTFAARFFPATAPVMAIATPIISALTEIKQKADANPNDSIHIDQLQPIISKLTLLPKIGPKIADVLKDLHLEQAVHSPEAPDIQPPTPVAPAA